MNLRGHATSVVRWIAVSVVLIGLAVPLVESGEKPRSPVTVKIEEEKAVVIDPVLPIDPVVRVKYQHVGNLSVAVRDEENRTLHLSHFPTLHIDGQVFAMQFQPPPNGRFETDNAALPKTPGGKERHGYYSVYLLNDLRITMTVEVVATKPAERADKRRLDSVLIRYQVENKGKQARKFGLRIYMDTYVIDNDGCQFAAPTMPGKILNGVELKDKTMPAYLQMLQRPDLKNPGFVSHLTLGLGSGFDKPDRLVMTQHGIGFNGWDMQAQQAGDTAIGIFWEPKEIKPGGKRDIAYGYGQGITYAPESEGRVSVQLGGSFEPGKLFTVTAQVHDPVAGQTLALDLPAGMQCVEGKAIQPVPVPAENQPHSLVLWKARVLEPGRFPLRVRSSTGVTQSKIVTVSKAE